VIKKNKINILIADKHSILRAGLISLLDNHPDIKVIGEAVDENDTINKVLTLKPQLLLTEILLTNKNNVETISNIKKSNPNLKILVLTMHSCESYIHAALNAGVNGYILKKDNHNELFNAIISVANGGLYLSPSISNSTTFEHISMHKSHPDEIHNDKLTKREIEILKLIARGYRNKDIAEMLSISNKTVTKHRFNFMRKLNLHNTSEITTYVIKNKSGYIWARLFFYAMYHFCDFLLDAPIIST
jgi:two-component system response regulator NreC